jgi:hypothetical protein
MINLLTVTNRVTALKQMIDHYRDIVDHIYVVVYQTSPTDTIVDDVKKLGITPYKIVTGEKYQFETVTSLYNEVKSSKPDDWWIVADVDELHIYPTDIRTMIDECEKNGWEFITGGFIDRIGDNGNFPIIDESTNLWKTFPYGGFFRYPASDACPNKVCVMKGNVTLSNGQHYAVYDGETVWGTEGTKHPKRYPIEKGFIQVHHFKWDSTVIDRLREVSEIQKDYTYWWEYKKMFDFLTENNYIVGTNDKHFYIESLTNQYTDYTHWKTITNKIITI